MYGSIAAASRRIDNLLLSGTRHIVTAGIQHQETVSDNFCRAASVGVTSPSIQRITRRYSAPARPSRFYLSPVTFLP